MLNKEELQSIGIFDIPIRNNKYNRIEWDDYFMSIASLVSRRSHDAQTQHGCCLVRDNRIISTGFNGFPSGSQDDILPNIRDGGYKYLFINHAEESAIFDAARRGISIEDSIAYITGHPCAGCCRKLVSVGIFKWIIGNVSHQFTPQEEILQRYWIDNFQVKIRRYSGNIIN